MNDTPEGPQGDAPSPPIPPPYVPTVGGDPSDDHTAVLPDPAAGTWTAQQPTAPQPPAAGQWPAPPAPGPQGAPGHQSPPGYPSGPPTAAPLGAPTPQFGAPQHGAPQYGAPQYGAPPFPGQAPVGTAAGTGSTGGGSSKVIVIILIASFVALALGAIAVFGLFAVGSSSLEVTVRQCEIMSDGTLTASGTVSGVSNGDAVDVTVEFFDVDTDEVIDTGSTGVDVSLAGTGAPDAWVVTGQAGDEVQQVRCDVEAST